MSVTTLKLEIGLEVGLEDAMNMIVANRLRKSFEWAEGANRATPGFVELEDIKALKMAYNYYVAPKDHVPVD